MSEHITSTANLSRAVPNRSSSFPTVSGLATRRAEAGRTYHCCMSLALGAATVLSIACGPARSEPTRARPRVVDSVGAPFADFVAEASLRFGIPAPWIRAVMHAESFDDMHAISSKGAIGLMQIVPETWAGLRQRYGLGANPYDPHDNIIAGAAYLRELYDRYGIPGFLAAYNAGPARWEDHLVTGRSLPAETRAYLIRLLPIVAGTANDDTTVLAAVVESWTAASLFPAPPANPPNDKSPAFDTQPPHPPATRPAQDWTGLAPHSDGLFVAVSSREPWK